MRETSRSVSIILTIHNKENLISRVARALLKNASLNVIELIVVFDGCSDKSEFFFDKTLKSFKNSHIKIIRCYADDVFETKANNIGLKCATGSFVCIIQDDMVIQEKDFDQRLLKPFFCFNDCFAVTGRTAHDVEINDDGKTLKWTNLVGRDEEIDESYLIQFETTFVLKILRKLKLFKPERNIFSVRDVVNRGPLMIKLSMLKKLGYLDELFAPFTLDDHDLCLKAYKKYGWVCGSYVIDYLSDLKWGSTRRNEKIAMIVKNAEKKNMKIIIDRYSDHIRSLKHDEYRIAL